MKIADDLMSVIDNACGLTPRISRTIQCAGSARQLRLNQCPINRERGRARKEDDCWTSASRAMEMDLVPANVNQYSRRRGVDIGGTESERPEDQQEGTRIAH